MVISRVTSDDIPAPARVLKGFEHINRYWDKYHRKFAAKILPGEFYVTISDEEIVTVLGSCVSACIRDRVFGIGGMNHFMLPSTATSLRDLRSQLSEATRYGNYAMEHLINEILKNGGDRRNLEIKVFGGGKVIEHMSDVGRRNSEFVIDYIATEGLAIAAKDLGDRYPRKVIYFPKSGKVKVKKLREIHNDTIIKRESAYMDSLKQKPIEGEIELF